MRRVRRFPLSPLILLLLTSHCAFGQSAGASTSAPNKGNGQWDGPLILQSSPSLEEAISPASQDLRPIYLWGDSLSGAQESQTTLQGNAELRKGDIHIRADRMDYIPRQSQTRAQGNVYVNKAGDVYRGADLDINIETYKGYFDDVNYRLRENQAHGTAQRVSFINKNEVEVEQGDYTTCQRAESDPEWKPDWQIRARELYLDRVNDVGIAKGAVLEFMGVPLLPVPYLSFPLSDKRKSGFLPPTVGIDSVSGVQYKLPYYWNIAPNRDATISTMLMARRGVNVDGEFRYLERDFSGEITGRYMPYDSLRDRDRWSYNYKHRQNIPVVAGNMWFDWNINRVGDDDYWRDFPRFAFTLTDRLLPSEGNYRWNYQDLQFKTRALKWQTLQDLDSVILPPYNMLPQLNLQYKPYNLNGGIDLVTELDGTRFQGNRQFDDRRTDGDRAYALVRVSRPYIRPEGFITPSVQLHASRYRLDEHFNSGTQSYSRVLPTANLDSGLFFERSTSFFGRNIIQTLEPRAFYTYTPYKDQGMLPMFDTAELDFTFASIYSSNSFVGNDRIADNNLLTLGMTSKLIDPDSGAELLRAGFAQRMRFKDQRVTSPGESIIKERWSDILLGGAVNWSQKWSINSVIQYNYKDRRTARYTLAAQYKPVDFRVLSMGYRMKRDASKQFDFGWQWPLNNFFSTSTPKTEQHNGRWYSVGRLNYSVKDKKLVDSVIGFEYSSCCWAGRVVLERLQNSYHTANTRLLFQIELTGLSGINIGSDPLSSLSTNVPGYQNTRENTSTPSSRFGSYD